MNKNTNPKNSNTKLNRAIAARNDEYYTPMKTVQRVFEVYLSSYDFKDKIVYCPCDSSASNFVIYLLAHKSDLQYKELIYTWDDYNSHHGLFNKADIIITNPPFSKLIREFLPLINYYQKDYFLFGVKASLDGYYKQLPNANFYKRDFTFEVLYTTDKNEEKRVETVYITNLNLDSNFQSEKFVPVADELSPVFHTRIGLRVYDRIIDIPRKECLPDPKEKFLVPVTVLLQHNRYLFNILGTYRDKFFYSDGRHRFARIIIQYK